MFRWRISEGERLSSLTHSGLPECDLSREPVGLREQKCWGQGRGGGTAWGQRRKVGDKPCSSGRRPADQGGRGRQPQLTQRAVSAWEQPTLQGRNRRDPKQSGQTWQVQSESGFFPGTSWTLISTEEAEGGWWQEGATWGLGVPGGWGRPPGAGEGQGSPAWGWGWLAGLTLPTQGAGSQVTPSSAVTLDVHKGTDRAE